MSTNKSSVYSYAYLPKWVKPWAQSCLEHLGLNSSVRYMKYEVDNYEANGLITKLEFEAHRHQLWVMYENDIILGCCLTSRLHIRNTEYCNELFGLKDDNHLAWFTITDKENVFVLVQCYDREKIQKSFFPTTALEVSHDSVLAHVKDAKTYDALKSFQEETKNDFYFEESD